MPFSLSSLAFEYPSTVMGDCLAIHADCFEWLAKLPENSLHAVVTDPPYGVKEYQDDQLDKREQGTGGVWRIPPSFDGSQRAPLPRFTALNAKEITHLKTFFKDWATQLLRVMRPGAHLFIASNAFLSLPVFSSIGEAGLEFRGEIIRTVSTLRGGDRPKNAEEEFPFVSSLPRGSYEPWGLFRKPLDKGMKVSDCLREYGTGGLRRLPDGNPFRDLVPSERTSQAERQIAPHPSLKPQSFLRQLVYVSLPLGEGCLLDPFMGSGSTLAAAQALSLKAIGVERQNTYYQLAVKAIPQLALVNTQPLLGIGF